MTNRKREKRKTRAIHTGGQGPVQGISEINLRPALALLCLPFFASPGSSRSDRFPPRAAARPARGTFREYLELLSSPNDSVVSADIRKNVASSDPGRKILAAERASGETDTGIGTWAD